LRPHARYGTLGPFKAIRSSKQELPAVKLSEHVRSTLNLDGAVVLDILHGEMFQLNFVGSRMLELLKAGFTNAQIADAISRDFGVARETVTADLEEFVAHLEKHSLLDLAEPGRRPAL
jgi:Coenzyme PQQ synthesis protein D (PqqD)